MLDWWDIKNKLPVYTNFKVWSWLNWFDNHLVKIGWGVSISEALWYLWLNRNRFVFEHKHYIKEELIMLIKIRAFRWCQVSNLIPDHRMNNWSINPKGFIISHLRSIHKSLFNFKAEFYGCTDDFFVRKDAMNYKAGMEGYLEDAANTLLSKGLGKYVVESCR